MTLPARVSPALGTSGKAAEYRRLIALSGAPALSRAWPASLRAQSGPRTRPALRGASGLRLERYLTGYWGKRTISYIPGRYALSPCGRKCSAPWGHDYRNTLIYCRHPDRHRGSRRRCSISDYRSRRDWCRGWRDICHYLLSILSNTTSAIIEIIIDIIILWYLFQPQVKAWFKQT